jgi:hypothetical protein
VFGDRASQRLGGDVRLIVVSGALANKCRNGGEAWVRLSWARGMRRLGFRVIFLEQIAPAACVGESGGLCDVERSDNLAYFQAMTEQFGLAGSCALIDESSGDAHGGLTRKELLDLAPQAELLVNISGHLTLPELFARFRRKTYIDIDPGFTQFWHAQGNAGAHLLGHDLFFTIGQHIGTAGCCIPTSGIHWRHTRQPVVLDDWPVCRADDPDRLTTVASWRGAFGSVTFEEQRFGLKVHEFRKFIDLPRRVAQTLEVALDIHRADEKDREQLEAHGWRVVSPRQVAADPFAFRRYVQHSGGEFSAAQGIYVETNSGWFSDRTVRYLASGKPALVQDTGFSDVLPGGKGLVPFRTLEQAIAGAADIAANYDEHVAAARAIATSCFDSDHVLGRLLEESGVAL